MKGPVRPVLAGFFLGLFFLLPTLPLAALAFIAFLIVLSIGKKQK